MTAIPIDADGDDVFAPPGSSGSDVQRPSIKSHESFMSESTFTDEFYDEKGDDFMRAEYRALRGGGIPRSWDCREIWVLVYGDGPPPSCDRQTEVERR